LILTVITLANGASVRAQDGTTQPSPSPTPTSSMTIHVVQRGENLFRIAQLYGTTVEAIASANGINDATQIQIGQRLLVPNAAPGAPGIPVDYVVQASDSLHNLSLRFGMPIQAIAQQNRIVNPHQMYIGQNLSLQDGAGTQTEIKKGWLHIVRPDDNLYRIAVQYSQPVALLMRVNHLKQPAPLFPGQRIVIPGKEDSPSLADVPLPLSTFTMQPAPAQQGRTMMLYLTSPAPAKITGSFMGRPFVVYSDAPRQIHIILYGIHAFAKPGIYKLDLTITDDQGGQTNITRAVSVTDGGYIAETITLPKDQADLLDPKVTEPEVQQIMKVVSGFTPQRHFEGPMGLPCPAPVTSQFGTRRSYNGGPFSQFHTGADFAAVPGSPVYAPAAGVVVMTATLNVRGNATIIDHGWGVYSGYWHQNEIKVKVGDIVRQGQVIGTIGSTGRVTGPHLHWELFVGGVQVDPLQWARQSFS
jgi:murein DD-endopeptidase MepM/ murein hydrolase activator NlpD